MSIYEYWCDKCEQITEYEFPFAKCPMTAACKKCGKDSPRYLGGPMTFILKGSGWPSKTNAINNDITRKQEQAGKRMRKNWKPPKLVDQR